MCVCVLIWFDILLDSVFFCTNRYVKCGSAIKSEKNFVVNFPGS
jgi:hypothetical protein